MEKPLTEEALGVIWEGEERAGILVYGYWQGEEPDGVGLTLKPWPRGTQARMFTLRDVDSKPARWTILEWTVLLPTWPAAEAWCDLVQSCLMEVCVQGAKAAWCGLEGHFAQPPSLFVPEEMGEGVWAFFSTRSGFECSAELGRPFAAFNRAKMAAFRTQIEQR